MKSRLFVRHLWFNLINYARFSCARGLMKIGLIGYGKMGKAVEEIALEKRYAIPVKINRSKTFDQYTPAQLKDVDIFIDFSHADCIVEHLIQVASLKKNIIVGTSGWQNQSDKVEEIVKDSGIGFLFAPNFSIGFNLFLEVVKQAAALFNGFPEFDVGGMERHHHQKADSPSGTARAIVETLISQLDHKTTAVFDKIDRKIEPHELHFASLRCGVDYGTHEVLFESPSDSLTFTYKALNRKCFAQGAILAAEWLMGKNGIFTIQQLFNRKQS